MTMYSETCDQYRARYQRTDAHSESNKSLNVCPVVEDEMDEEDMDDQEEQSEESRAVRVGQKKMMTPTLA